MNETSKELTICNPLYWQLEKYTKQILDDVQLGASSRLIGVPLLDKVFEQDEGCIESYGNKPPENNGRVSRLGIFWFVDHQTNRHIRICSDRVNASKWVVPCLYFKNKPMTHWVFPDEEDHRCMRCRNDIDIKSSYWQEDSEMFLCLTCHDMENYYKETGFKPIVIHKHYEIWNKIEILQ